MTELNRAMSKLPLWEVMRTAYDCSTAANGSTDIYIEDVLKNKEKQKSEEEYELYLKLKEKYEK